VSGPVELSQNTKLALDRTRIAYDRTMLAWVRTAASLISFGFSIYKFFELKDGSFPPTRGLIGPREFGTLMIVLGITSLAFATFDHRRQLQMLRAEYGHSNVPYTSSAVLAGLVALLGVVAFFAVIFRQ
jgi:putative membrane protein